MRLAYLVSAYKLPENLVRLVTRLAADGESVVVHVDKRAPTAVHRLMAAPFEDVPNVHFLPSHRSPYASYGHVQTTVKGLSLLHRIADPYDFVVLLTGQDYPIKPLAAARAQLASHLGQTFMEHFPLPAESWHRGGLPRLERWHFSTPHGLHAVRRSWLRPLVPQGLPLDLAPHGGSGYWTMCRDHAEYALDFVGRNPAYTRFFRRAGIPDEIFFQTILMNSPHAAAVVNDALRYVDWDREEYPAIFGIGDLELLRERPEPFARKFDCSRDEEILDALDQLADQPAGALSGGRVP